MPSVNAEFLDTNILLYEWDSTDSGKRQDAQKLVRRLGRHGVISSQVAQEFAWNAMRKLGLSPSETDRILASYEVFRFVPVEMALIKRATRTSSDARISFWDALIVEAAATAACRTLFTEDLNHGQVISGVRIVNPFR